MCDASHNICLSVIPDTSPIWIIVHRNNGTFRKEMHISSDNRSLFDFFNSQADEIDFSGHLHFLKMVPDEGLEPPMWNDCLQNSCCRR